LRLRKVISLPSYILLIEVQSPANTQSRSLLAFSEDYATLHSIVGSTGCKRALYPHPRKSCCDLTVAERWEARNAATHFSGLIHCPLLLITHALRTIRNRALQLQQPAVRLLGSRTPITKCISDEAPQIRKLRTRNLRKLPSPPGRVIANPLTNRKTFPSIEFLEHLHRGTVFF
jgi:hypothetical protein